MSIQLADAGVVGARSVGRTGLVTTAHEPASHSAGGKKALGRPGETSLPLCEWCHQQQVRRKGRRFCGRTCAGLFVSTLPQNKAALKAHHAQYLPKNRTAYVERTKKRLRAVAEPFAATWGVPVAEVIKLALKIEHASYTRGYSVAWMRTFRREAR